MSESLTPLAIAFGAAWLLIGAYVAWLARAQRKLNERLDNLSRSE